MKSICFIWTKPFDFLGAVSNFCLNTKIIIFPLHHGESKLHLNDMMMSALYYNTLHHGESKLHLNDMMMSALYYNTYIMVRASYISMIWWCLLCTTTHLVVRFSLYLDYEIGICCFSAKHAALRRKSKDLLARNQNNVSEWIDMSIRGLLFQWTSTIKI
jgi:hypothetical protein